MEAVGFTPATKLIGLAITLDHSEGFPFREVQAIQKELPEKAKVAIAVLTDLVVRHTQIFKLRPETLRGISGLIGVNTVDLLEKGASI